jgi:hypothetical protein
VGTNTVNINKYQVEHMQILNKTQIPGTKSLEKLQVQKNLITPTGLQRKRQSPKMKPKYHEKSTSPKTHPKHPKLCQ